MSKFFIRRPIVAIVIAIITVVVGLVSMLNLPTSQYPDIVPPEIMVQATYPGADARTLQQAVATPIEQQMNGVDNMLYMYSVSANNGQATVYVDFDVKTDPNTDQILAQMRQSQAASQLPAAVVNQGVTVQKTSGSPLLGIALYSPSNTYDGVFLANYAVLHINDEMTREMIARFHQFETRVTNSSDELVFHSKDGVILYPRGMTGGEFWSLV